MTNYDLPELLAIKSHIGISPDEISGVLDTAINLAEKIKVLKDELTKRYQVIDKRNLQIEEMKEEYGALQAQLDRILPVYHSALKFDEDVIGNVYNRDHKAIESFHLLREAVETALKAEREGK
jgi:conjugal transfer/entry exclusion protein